MREYDPFIESESLFCIVSGSTGDATINSHETLQVGIKIVESAYNKETFGDVEYKRKMRIKSLQNVLSAPVAKGAIDIDPTLLFQRIASAVESKNLKSYLAFELAPRPESIFENGFFRKSSKSDL